MAVVFINPDFLRVRQTWVNIIVNAAQAIKEQERQGRGKIMISTGASADHVWRRIQDDGPGIKPEHLSKVFAPFFLPLNRWEREPGWDSISLISTF